MFGAAPLIRRVPFYTASNSPAIQRYLKAYGSGGSELKGLLLHQSERVRNSIRPTITYRQIVNQSQENSRNNLMQYKNVQEATAREINRIANELKEAISQERKITAALLHRPQQVIGLMLIHKIIKILPGSRKSRYDH